MKNLISMTDFVLEQTEPDWLELCEFEENSRKIYNYAQFLKRPLDLGMFVPCDENGDVLIEPTAPEYPYNDKECDVWSQYEIYLIRYKKAKERCLFDVTIEFKNNYPYKGVDISFNGTSAKIEYNINTKRFFFGVRTIEDLTDFQPQLTETAIKQIGL